MKTCEYERIHEPPAAGRIRGRRPGLLAVLLGSVVLLGSPASSIIAQQAGQKDLLEQVQRLTDAMARAQAQLEASQQQLLQMRAQLTALQRQVTQSADGPQSSSAAPPESDASSSQASTSLAAAVQDLREQQAIQGTEIATQEQAKVESESRFPVKVAGLLLMSGFVNSRAVDIPATPTVALPGSGSTGASWRQTILGIDARGPHVLGAGSYADLLLDFDGNPATGTAAAYGSYSSTAALLRLRTAHAGLQWPHTGLSFALDRPILSPGSPASLTAVAVPALAWSGNLWTWNPQAVLTQDLDLPASSSIRLQTALIDVADAPLTPLASSSATVAAVAPSTAEQSRWPGVQARVAWLGHTAGDGREGNRFGVGGYFAPHDSTFLARRFDSWAGTLDANLLLPEHFEFTGSFYRGQALGGLGGGAYKDFVYREDQDTGGYYSRILDDVGGWAQLKQRFSERLEANAAFGIDNAFAGDLRRYAVPGGTMYQNLARNLTYTGNVIYSPSAWLLFSLEYRHLISSPIVGLPAESDILGLGAGYRF